MTARRQSSTTSLSKYAHDPAYQQQDEQQPNSLDFCNAFWGVADGGVDVLFARMRGASRTVEELRNFFKERALIEEDYAKRMAKLSKQALGRDEIGYVGLISYRHSSPYATFLRHLHAYP
jgi:hypothetical protein